MFFSKNNKTPNVTKTIGNQKTGTIEYFKATLGKKPKPAKKGMKVLDGTKLK